MIGKRKELAQMDLILEEVTNDTKNRIKELSFSYEKLSQILKKMPVSKWRLEEDEIRLILGRISVEVCTGCEFFYRCYRKETGELVKTAKKMLAQLEQNGTGASVRCPEDFQNYCMHPKEFVAALLQSYEILSVHKVWRNKMYYQRKAMAAQMEEMSRILFGCSIMLGFDKTQETRKERQLRRLLRKEKVNLGPVRFYENQAKKQEVFLLASAKKNNCSSARVAELLSKTIRKNMIPAEDCKLSVYQKNTLLHFEEDKNYYLLCGNAGKAKTGNPTSGDIFSVMRLKQGRQICILADGMGTGEKAREESRYIVELMEQFLEAGFREEETVRLANSMLTFGQERNIYSSFDFFSFHLYTGFMKLIKSGSASTYLIRNGKVEIIRSKTPPSGFFWEVEFDVLYKKLYDGDKIILVTDGMTDRIGGEDPENGFAEKLPELCGENPCRAAENILSWVLSFPGEKVEDDMSVLAIYVWKKNHPF